MMKNNPSPSAATSANPNPASSTCNPASSTCNPASSTCNPAGNSANRALILLTQTAFIPHKSRREEVTNQQQCIENIHDPRSHCKSFTGVDMYELAYCYLALTKHTNVEVDLVTNYGGAIPADPDSIARLMKDDQLMKEISNVNDFIASVGHTWPIKAIKPCDYKFAIVLGSYGAMFDLPACTTVQSLMHTIYFENEGYLCTIGHGAAALLNVPSGPRRNEFLISAKKITCSTNREEREKRLDNVLPYLLEDKLAERGAQISTADSFKPYVVVHERLITAQNSVSVREFVKRIGEVVFNKSIEL